MPTTQAIFQIVTPAAARQQLDDATSNCDQQIQTIVTTSATFATTTTKKRVNFCSSCVEPAVIKRDFAFPPDDPRYWLLAGTPDDDHKSTTVESAQQKPKRRHSITIKKPSYRKIEASPRKGGTSHKGSASRRNPMVVPSTGVDRLPTPFSTLEGQISSQLLLQKSITLFKHAASTVANYRPSFGLWF